MNLVGTNPYPAHASRYDNYYLSPQPGKGNRGNIDGLDDKKMTIDQWIEKVARNEQASEFLFPSKTGPTGGQPDLMFFLHSDVSMILCVVQVRDLELQSEDKC